MQFLGRLRIQSTQSSTGIHLMICADATLSRMRLARHSWVDGRALTLVSAGINLIVGRPRQAILQPSIGGDNRRPRAYAMRFSGSQSALNIGRQTILSKRAIKTTLSKRAIKKD